MIARPSKTLTIDSPSPTTVSYSVSNKRHPKSKLVARVRATARVVLVSYAILIDLSKAQTIVDLGYVKWHVDLLLKISLTNPLVQIVASYAEWWVLATLTAITLYVCLRRNYTGRIVICLSPSQVRAHSNCRRVLACATWTGYSNVYKLFILLPKPNHDIHCNDSDPGYRDT